MTFTPSGGIRWQVGRTLDDMRLCILRGDVLTLADLTRFLLTVASPHIPQKERTELIMPECDIGWDFDGDTSGRVMEDCLTLTERILGCLKKRGIYTLADTPDGGTLGAPDLSPGAYE